MTKLNSTAITVTKEISHNVQNIIGDRLRKIILYGSYARGDYKDYSDLDIMVLANMDERECKALESKMDTIVSDIGLEHDIIISVLINNENLFMRRLAVSPFYRNVLSEGVEIYGTY